MKLCIAEKPSVAREIANILGARESHKGYLAGNGYYVSWTLGHLCTLKEPHDYSTIWKAWRMDTLPILPSPFGIKIIKNKGVEEQFKVIEELIGKVDEVINCGDAGQEGELIQRWVMQMARCHCPVRRLWISSMTDEAIKDGFRTLHPASDYDLLYQAGMSRAIGDWLLGMNATRSYTLKYSSGKGQVLSIGRVQTPTLNMIVERCREIEIFKPEPYWELKTVYRETIFSCVKGKLKSEEEANMLLDKVKNNLLTVISVSEKQGKESAPRLFDLTSLQVECNKKFSFSADMTLKVIQSLYEKKVTTYPRVDTTYLPDDMYPKIEGIMQSLAQAYIVDQNVRPVIDSLKGTRLPKTKKVFDNSKITDHHAIIPTGMVNANLTTDEWKVFNLIVKHFVANFMEDCHISTTTVLAEVPTDEKSVGFKVTGKVIAKPGWRVLFINEAKEEQTEGQDKEDEESQTLPQFVKGESGEHKPKTIQKQTNPPKYYTEATLLRAMETAGRKAENEEIREAMKENGIGRPSTRAAIIETLLKRGYIVKQRKTLIATETGRQLIDTIKDPQLKSAELTGEWEHKLRMIERGEYKAAQFIGELKQLATSVVEKVRNDNSGMTIVATTPLAKELKAKAVARKRNVKPKIVEGMACPKCGKGIVIRGKRMYGCSRWREGCDFRAEFDDKKRNQ